MYLLDRNSVEILFKVIGLILLIKKEEHKQQ